MAGRTRAFVAYARDLRLDPIDVAARPESFDPRDGQFWDDAKQVDKRNARAEDRLGRPLEAKEREPYQTKDRQDRACVAAVRRYLLESYPGTLEFEQAAEQLKQLRSQQRRK